MKKTIIISTILCNLFYLTSCSENYINHQPNIIKSNTLIQEIDEKRFTDLIFNYFDRDSDGTLSSYGEATSPLLDADGVMDKNHDAKITEQEFKTVFLKNVGTYTFRGIKKLRNYKNLKISYIMSRITRKNYNSGFINFEQFLLVPSYLNDEENINLSKYDFNLYDANKDEVLDIPEFEDAIIGICFNIGKERINDKNKS